MRSVIKHTLLCAAELLYLRLRHQFADRLQSIFYIWKAELFAERIVL
jgi:hypothetical protein